MEVPILGHCDKVEFFWEAYKIEESFDITKREISLDFVAFSEYFNFTKSSSASHSQLSKLVFLRLASQNLRPKDQVAST